MSNPIILQLKVKKTELAKELKDHEIKLSRLLCELAERVCPFYGEISDIKAEEIMQISKELYDTKNKALELQSDLKKISSELGE